MPPADLDVDSLLANARWLRRLSRGLAGTDSEADDLVQDAWVAALRAPPDPTRPVRPWLAQVVRNLVGMGRRRTARWSLDREVEVASRERGPEDLLASLQLQRRLATLVWELEEPYRATVLMRFYEEMAAPEIAAKLGVPAGTVRWRLSEGVRRLRERLDEREGRWRVVVLGAPARRWARWPAVLAAVGAAVVVARGPLADRRPSGPPAATTPSGGRSPSPGEGPPSPAGTQLAGLATAVPALVSAAGDNRPFTRDELIDDCLAHRQVLVACPLVAVEDWSRGWRRRFTAEHGPPSDADVAAFRRQVLDRLAEIAATPAEDRRDRCAESVDAAVARGDARMPRSLEARWHACAALSDCQRASDCAGAVYHQWADRPDR